MCLLRLGVGTSPPRLARQLGAQRLHEAPSLDCCYGWNLGGQGLPVQWSCYWQQLTKLIRRTQADFALTTCTSGRVLFFRILFSFILASIHPFHSSVISLCWLFIFSILYTAFLGSKATPMVVNNIRCQIWPPCGIIYSYGCYLLFISLLGAYYPFTYSMFSVDSKLSLREVP